MGGDKLLLVVNVHYKIPLQWRAKLEAILEVLVVADNLSDLFVGEEALLLEVVELVGHLFYLIMNNVCHFLLDGDGLTPTVAMIERLCEEVSRIEIGYVYTLNPNFNILGTKGA